MGWRTIQTYGPSARHPQGCVELRFTTEVGSHDMAALAGRVRGLGITLAVPPAPVTSPEAVGLLAAAVLNHEIVPAWSWGSDSRRRWVCLSHPDPRLAEAALISAYGLIVDDPRRKVINELAKVAAAVRSLNPNSLLMMHAASGLDLYTAGISSFLPVYQVGQGARSAHYCEVANQADGFTGHLLSKDKRGTVEILGRFGLPTTRAMSASRREQVGEAVRRIGFPCVVKPVASGSGRGVTVGIRSPERLGAAVDDALRHGGFPLLVESHVTGDDHRMTVINGELAWVYRRRPPYVIGDGRSTIGELIVQENARRVRASPAHRAYLKPIEADAAVRLYLQEHYGFDEASVPAKERRIELTGVANLARGGTLKDVTSRVHPDNRELALRVAEVFRLHTVGIDLNTPDIATSWRGTPSAILEINTAPGISGPGDASLALRTALPNRLSGRIPAFVAVGEPSYCQDIAVGLLAALKKSGLKAIRADHSDETGFDTVPLALRERRVEAIVVTCSPDGLVRLGLPVQRCEMLFTQQVGCWAESAGVATRTVSGPVAPAELEAMVAEAIDPFVTGRLGGSRPTLDWLAGEGPVAPRLRLWRLHALPAGTFWSQVLSRSVTKNGMVGAADLLAAVVHLADEQLARAGQAPSGVRIALAGPDGPWEAPYLDVEVPLPEDRAGIVAAALQRAMDGVNAIVGQKR